MPKKICTKCHAEKPLEEYYPQAQCRDGRATICKVCTQETTRRWFAANRERACENARRYNAANPEKRRELRRRWQAANPEKRKASLRKSNAKKRSTVAGQLSHLISVAMRTSLRYGKQRRKWESLVGYDLNRLKRHLEKQFLPGMSWENRSQWHIDHKIPISAFNYEQPTDIDFKRCWALKNLRPLWKHDNLVKHTKIDKPFQPGLLI